MRGGATERPTRHHRRGNRQELAEAASVHAVPLCSTGAHAQAEDDRGGMTDSLYAHAPFYRMLHDERRGDLPFYLEATAGRGRVLEYGVGTGRVALPMARRGQRVVGVDVSAEMLASFAADLRAEAPAVRERVRLVHADARTLVLPERFDAITCPYNGIAHHHGLAELGAFLERVRQHLEPGGVLVFDVLVPDPRLMLGSTSEIPWFRDPESGVPCRATERIEYEPLTQVLTITTTTRAMEGERPPVELVLRLRLLFPEETRLLLRHHGLEVLRREELGDVIGYVCREAG
jgi:SAM-dependent methyltransferase